jgi:hypothetical protein
MTKTRTPRVGTVHTLKPVGLFDLMDSRVMAHEGEQVKVVQPFGCPKNGTMGHLYVERADTGEFIGLVLVSSLAPKEEN